jgi:hypothetical protein
MVRNTQVLWPTLGAILLGVTLAGCGGSTPAENTTGTAETGTTTSQTTQTATTDTASSGGENTKSEAPAELAAFFPGATLTKKAFPMDASAAAHLSGMAKVKFTGDEKEWEVYEAAQNGARVGYAMMTHFSGSGGDTHAVFAVDKSFNITKADALDAPKMKPLMAQAVGKNHDAKWKVGQDFKPVAGVSQADAQAAVDSLHKGVLILEENFNPNHGAHEHGGGAAGGTSAPGHNDDGHAH